ncbi:unnamed protein product [Brassicogethes aeneus]|uniref:Uncharacterized protein n=1 Tax=Brassicogethes aeneus TaxID=1431903 RepID=A0A9P0FM82_BRAAE|nr:unnamed protein product [Brassicogethes aeneus]
MGRERAPSGTAVVKLVKKVREIGLLLDIRKGPRARTHCPPENIEAVSRSVVRRRSQQLAISRTRPENTAQRPRIIRLQGPDDSGVESK